MSFKGGPRCSCNGCLVVLKLSPESTTGCLAENSQPLVLIVEVQFLELLLYLTGVLTITEMKPFGFLGHLPLNAVCLKVAVESLLQGPLDLGLEHGPVGFVAVTAAAGPNDFAALRFAAVTFPCLPCLYGSVRV